MLGNEIYGWLHGLYKWHTVKLRALTLSASGYIGSSKEAKKFLRICMNAPSSVAFSSSAPLIFNIAESDVDLKGKKLEQIAELV